MQLLSSTGDAENDAQADTAPLQADLQPGQLSSNVTVACSQQQTAQTSRCKQAAIHINHTPPHTIAVAGLSCKVTRRLIPSMHQHQQWYNNQPLCTSNGMAGICQQLTGQKIVT
jgi:hypothetical protein